VIAVFGNDVAIYPEVDRPCFRHSGKLLRPVSGIELILVPHGDPGGSPSHSGACPPIAFVSLRRRRPGTPGTPVQPRAHARHVGLFLPSRGPEIGLRLLLVWLQRWRQRGFPRVHGQTSRLRVHLPITCESICCKAGSGPPRNCPGPLTHGGWVEMFELRSHGRFGYLPGVFFQKEGGFTPSPLCSGRSGGSLPARATRTDSIAMLNSDPPACRCRHTDFPLANDLGLSGDLVARRVVRRSGSPPELHDSWRLG